MALARELGVTRAAVWSWIAPANPPAPALRTAAHILVLSRTDKRSCARLEWEDIYGKPWQQRDARAQAAPQTQDAMEAR